MHRFEQRRDPARLMWRRVMAAVLFIILAFAVRGVWGVYRKAQESRELKVEAEAKLSDLEKREAQLRADISNLHTESGIEAQLRERYDLAKDDEGVIVIVDPQAPPPEPRPTGFQKLRGWFSWW